MRILLEGEQHIRVDVVGEGLEIAGSDPHVSFSPLHMLAASLATCTVAVLAGWAEQAELPLDGLVVDVRWEYVEDPYRVGRYDLRIEWPGLPPARRAAAARVAGHCTVEHTLRHPPAIEIAVA